MMSKQHNQQFVELVDAAKQRIQELSPAQLHKHMQHNPSLVLLDVREESEYAAGHVKEAQHLGKGVIERDIGKTVPDAETEIVLYCGGGYRSALAADNLQKMGYVNVYSLAGGFRALKKEGRFEVTVSP